MDDGGGSSMEDGGGSSMEDGAEILNPFKLQNPFKTQEDTPRTDAPIGIVERALVKRVFHYSKNTYDTGSQLPARPGIY